MKLRKQAAVVSAKRMRLMTPRESAEHQLSFACRLHDWPQAKLWLAELVVISNAEEVERSERAIKRFVELWEESELTPREQAALDREARESQAGACLEAFGDGDSRSPLA